jgi:ABC-type glycerol-3-phosphate transport system permease component
LDAFGCCQTKKIKQRRQGHTILRKLKPNLRDLELKKTLDNKSNTMITMSSAIAALLIGLGTFILTRIIPSTPFYNIAIFSIIAGIILALIAISLFVRSYTLKSYRYPMGHENFFEDKGKGKYKKEIVDKWRNADIEEYNDRIIQEYWESIRNNADNNKRKGRELKYGQWLFFGLVLSISVLLISLLIGSLLGYHLIKAG